MHGDVGTAELSAAGSAEPEGPTERQERRKRRYAAFKHEGCYRNVLQECSFGTTVMSVAIARMPLVTTVMSVVTAVLFLGASLVFTGGPTANAPGRGF